MYTMSSGCFRLYLHMRLRNLLPSFFAVRGLFFDTDRMGRQYGYFDLRLFFFLADRLPQGTAFLTFPWRSNVDSQTFIHFS